MRIARGAEGSGGGERRGGTRRGADPGTVARPGSERVAAGPAAGGERIRGRGAGDDFARKLATSDAQVRASDQTYREWIYRQAFHMGRHPIGYEVQSVLAAVDWLVARGKKVGVCGYAEGGQTAFYAAALDTRIGAALVSGYFDSRQRVWAEPIYRNVWGLLREFGDAEIAGLILPRTLVIEHSTVPEITGHKGDWHTPEYASVTAEAERIETGSLFPKPPLVQSGGIPFSEAAMARFAAALGVETVARLFPEAPVDKRSTFDAAARHLRYFREMEDHIQRLVQRSEHVRDRAFLFSVMPELEMRNLDHRAANCRPTRRRNSSRARSDFASGSATMRWGGSTTH